MNLTLSLGNFSHVRSRLCLSLQSQETKGKVERSSEWNNEYTRIFCRKQLKQTKLNINDIVYFIMLTTSTVIAFTRYWDKCLGNKRRMTLTFIPTVSGGSRISQMLGGGRQPLSLGQKSIIWQAFCQKLHENEWSWDRGDVPVAILNDVMFALCTQVASDILSLSIHFQFLPFPFHSVLF